MHLNIRRDSIASILACLLFLGSHTGYALPTGGNVVDGSATIINGTNTMTVNQTSHQAIIHYQNFDIAQNEIVQFNQPSANATAFNQVTNNTNPSQIYGTLQANGNVFVINSAGIVFHPTAIIDVGGLHAAAAQIGNDQYLESLDDLSNLSNFELTGVVENHGRIQADSMVQLIGTTVINTGQIIAPNGMIGFRAEEAIYVGEDGGHLFVELGSDGQDPETNDTNTLGAGDMYSLAISPLLKAQNITLDAGAEGIAEVSGTLDASNETPGETGGTVKVLGDTVILADEAEIDASGYAGGGEVYIGGGFQGNNPEIRNAKITYVAEGATIHADALTEGDGGDIIVWADGLTRFKGSLSARGGAEGGNGGFAEVSGKKALQWLAADGSVDLSAPLGMRGKLLLDPETITIVDDPAAADIDGADSPATDDLAVINELNGILDLPDDPEAASATAMSIISNDAIDSLLTSEAGDLILFADTSITVLAAIDVSVTPTGVLTFETEQLDIEATISTAISPTFVPIDSSATPDETPSLNIDVPGSTVEIDIEGDPSGVATADTVTITTTSGTTLSGDILLGDADDTLNFAAGSTFEGFIHMDDTCGECFSVSDDTVIINEGVTLTADIATGVSPFDAFGLEGSDNDTINFSGTNSITGGVFTGVGDDTINFSGTTTITSGVSEIDTGVGDDTINFFGTATLTGGVNGGDDIDIGDGFMIPSGDDTLDFTASTLITSVDPGGTGPIIVYDIETGDVETPGMTNPTDIISEGYININRVLLPSAPETPAQIISTNDQEQTSTSGQGECFSINCIPNLILLPKPIEDALIEQLVKIGIYARNNTEQETLQRLMGSSRFLQQINDRPKPNDFKVAAGRTEKDRIVTILDHYFNLINDGIQPIQKTLKQAYQQSGKAKGMDLRAYIEQNQDSELNQRALYFLNGYRDLFRKIKTAGLTPKEIEISQSVILRTIRVPGLDSKDLLKAIEGHSELNNGIQLTSSM